tara:strand:- start:182 stop:523 length:342 start_codon:yes stop_codon:yes gene_type:complete
MQIENNATIANHPKTWLIGRTVRSFDFSFLTKSGEIRGVDTTGERACYIEGLVIGIDQQNRIVVKMNKIIFGGEDLSEDQKCGIKARGGIMYAPLATFRDTDRLQSGSIQVIA